MYRDRYCRENNRANKKTFPELDVRVGDASNLSFPEDYFTGYWSLGVIEHDWNGYHDILREMQRVVVKGGYVFLTFPYMSFLRRLKAKLALYEEFNIDKAEKEHFYQFALNKKIVINDFEAAGFRLVASRPEDGLKGFKDEVGLFKPLLQRYYNYAGNNLLFKGARVLLSSVLATFAGHLAFLVFQKT